MRAARSIQRKILWWKAARMSSLEIQQGRRRSGPRAGGLQVEAIREVEPGRSSSGEFVAILGPSGCGKSTLLELCAGLEPVSRRRDPASTARRCTGPNPKAVMVFQEHSLFPWLNVEDNVGLRPEDEGRGAATSAGGAAREVLERVKLVKFAKHYPHQLSGGMKQRVAIARALVGNPEFILMDEPFAALDFQTRVLMQQFLLEVWLGLQVDHPLRHPPDRRGGAARRPRGGDERGAGHACWRR